MVGFVYILGGLTSLLSAILLYRGSRQSGSRLLFWSSLCFFAMGANNVLLYIHYATPPGIDLLMAARLVTLLGILLVNFGLIWYGN
jgi:hypothetical protein